MLNFLPDEPTKQMIRTVAEARLRASALPPYTGFGTPQDQTIIIRCSHRFRHHRELSVQLIFTRDQGMHASGWWKNPDYERCEHLSVSFVDPIAYVNVPQDHRAARLWCLAFWGTDRCRKLWIEPPYSPHGRRADVYHYRLFMELDWRTPLLPRKEVYTKEFTERGWKSWSDVHAPGEVLDDTPP